MQLNFAVQIRGVYIHAMVGSIDELNQLLAIADGGAATRTDLLNDVVSSDEATTSFGMANGSTIELTKSDETLTGVKEPIMVVEKPVTNEDVQDALRTVVVKKGFPAAQELLKEFGTVNARSLPAEKNAAFVQRATEVANG